MKLLVLIYLQQLSLKHRTPSCYNFCAKDHPNIINILLYMWKEIELDDGFES
jgi:hypothetical protein